MKEFIIMAVILSLAGCRMEEYCNCNIVRNGIDCFVCFECPTTHECIRTDQIIEIHFDYVTYDIVRECEEVEKNCTTKYHRYWYVLPVNLLGNKFVSCLQKCTRL